MAKTLYVKKEYHDRLNLSSFPNAGPYPCIEGLRQNVYGQNALLVKCGAYVYHVDGKTYEEAKELCKK